MNENQEENTVETTESTNKKSKKSLIFVIISSILLVVAIIIVIWFKNTTFDRLTSNMLHEYPYANNSRAKDDSYMKIDTNPYDKDVDELSFVEATTFEQTQNDSLKAIKYVNEKLGFSEALYQKMLETTALMGKQTDENKKYKVSWSYHPKSGLEVMYEKK